MNRHKILFCCNHYLPKFKGGAELIAHYQAQVLQSLGHEVYVFAGEVDTLREKYSTREDSVEGIKVYRINLDSKDYSSKDVNFVNDHAEKYFSHLINYLLPDIVHFHNIVGLSVGLIHIAKRRNIRSIVTLHDHWGFCCKNTLLNYKNEICNDYTECSNCVPFIADRIPIIMRNDFVRMQLLEADVLISPSKYLAETYIRAGFPSTRIVNIWNGIDVDHFSRVQKVKEDCIRFTFVGYFGKHKGVTTLIKALPLLTNKDRIRVNLVGDGEEYASLASMVEDLGCQSYVQFLGKVDRSEMAKVYQHTDVLVLPSVWPENQPVTITEAMAAQIPVIASRVGGIPELVEEGHTGYLFEVGNERDLAEKMSFFVHNPDSIDLFGANGWNKIKVKSLQEQVKQILDIYDKAPEQTMNRPTSESKLIVVIGEKVDEEFAEGMVMFLKEKSSKDYQFVLASWLKDNQLIKANLFCAFAFEGWVESILLGLKHRVPFLVPERDQLLRKLCITKKCGLVYKNREEVRMSLGILLEKKEQSIWYGENGYQFFADQLQEGVDLLFD